MKMLQTALRLVHDVSAQF